MVIDRAQPAHIQPALGRLRRLLAGGVALALALAGVTLAPTAASASTTLCSGTSYSVCVNAGYTDHGYGSNSANSYWQMDPGHNCTNYVAYVEQAILGVPAPTYSLGNAYQWGPNASAHGVPVTASPTVGAVAWWDQNAGLGSLGHVAYVESVNGDGSITVSEDAASSGPFDWMTISPGGSRWPTGFIHFKDPAPATWFSPFQANTGSLLVSQVSSSDQVAWTTDTGLGMMSGTSPAIAGSADLSRRGCWRVRQHGVVV